MRLIIKDIENSVPYYMDCLEVLERMMRLTLCSKHLKTAVQVFPYGGRGFICRTSCCAIRCGPAPEQAHHSHLFRSANNCFLAGLFQFHFKGNATFTKRVVYEENNQITFPFSAVSPASGTAEESGIQIPPRTTWRFGRRR